ncbi:MAG: hypothetical protein IID37_04120 [Planctomycetes bacterium]|nr:hypothetical protein [Planctomycetota bacterium]
MKKSPIAQGVARAPYSSIGTVVEWTDGLLDTPDLLKGKVVYDKGVTPLYRTAFIVENGARGLLMAAGGRNSHALILASEAGIPALAGIGNVTLLGQVVTIDPVAGCVYKGEVDVAESIDSSTTGTYTDCPPVYVNVSYPSALSSAASTGADGIGLLRTEFVAAKTLAMNLQVTMSNGGLVIDMLKESNEADTIYAMAEDAKLRPILRQAFVDVLEQAVQAFGNREIIVRTIDIPRRVNDPMGNRGIRRCIASGGATIRIVGEAVRSVLESVQANIGIVLPLVSHYSQIRESLSMLRRAGIDFVGSPEKEPGKASFGWEIEQPSGSQNNEIWLAAFTAEFGYPPQFIGIGTNDLTQFTIALGRDAYSEETDVSSRRYLKSLYDELDFSVVRQIVTVADQCRALGVRVFLLGEAASNPVLAPLLAAFDIIPSTSVAYVSNVRRMLHAWHLHGSVEKSISAYIDHAAELYPLNVRDVVVKQIEKFFAKHTRR